MKVTRVPCRVDPIDTRWLGVGIGLSYTAPHTYHRYAEGVRLEYAHVDEAEYRRGRAAVLRSFPETNEHLYFTPSMRDEREAMAHANIAAEVRLLQAQAE